MIRALLRMALLAGLGIGTAHAQTPTTIPLAAFVDSLGINIHINYKDGAYADAGQVAADLRHLGIVHVRQGIPASWGTVRPADFTTLAQQGVRFDMVLRWEDVENGFYQTFLHDLVQANPGSLAAIEGFNEINNWPVTYAGQTGPAAAQMALQAVYAAVHADPLLKGVPLFDMTGAPRVARINKRADVANAHPYPHNGRQPCGAVDRAFDEGYVQPAPLPRVITEIGNFTLPRDWPANKSWWHGYTMLGVDEATQAKSVIAAYFCAARAGVSRTYVYELLDEKPDPANTQPEMRFGVFRFDHSPKPAATAIRNLVLLLNQAAVRPGSAALARDAITAPASVRKLLLRKQGGGLILALWNDVDFWSFDGPLNAAPVPVTLRLSRPVAVDIFDPLAGTAPVARRGAALAIDIPVPDHPILVELIN